MKARHMGTTRTARAAARPVERLPAGESVKVKVEESAMTGANSHTRITREELDQMIASAAYFRAEKRGFAVGHELEDWLAAEAEIKRQLGQAAR